MRKSHAKKIQDRRVKRQWERAISNASKQLSSAIDRLILEDIARNVF